MCTHLSPPTVFVGADKMDTSSLSWPQLNTTSSELFYEWCAKDNKPCAIYNTRCFCIQCNPGLYSSDCSKTCLAPAVAILTDMLLATGGLWFFLATIYYYYSHTDLSNAVEEDAGEAEGAASLGSDVASSQQTEQMASAAREVARKSTLRVRALFRIALYHMQVVASILMSMVWAPDVPQFLVDLINLIRNVFTLNVPGMMSSPACASAGGAPMSPLAKWYLSLCFPLALCAVLYLWYWCSKGEDRLVMKEAGVQVVYVWLFSTISTACLKIVDCTEGTAGALILDPTLPCPLSPAGNPFPAIVGITVLALYIGSLLYHLLRVSRKPDTWFEEASNQTAWGWVVDDFVPKARSWEFLAVLTKTGVIAG